MTTLGRPVPRRLWAAIFGGWLIGVIWLLWGAAGTAATEWMYVFHPSDFITWRDLADYVMNLRVPIPVAVSVAEIIEYRLTGDLLVTTRLAYPAALLTAYVLAVRFAWGHPYTRIASMLLGLIYLVGTRWIHYANPQTYDVFFPCLILLYLTLLELATRHDGRHVQMVLAFGAGLALALTDLTRPFAVLLLPVLLAGAWWTLGAVDRRLFLPLLLPVLIISGGWHAHSLWLDGQFIWGNHSGYNLHRGWPAAVRLALIPDPDGAPLKPGRWANLNTPTHTLNSRRMQASVIAYWRSDPGAALAQAGQKLLHFAAPQTGFYNWHPTSPWLRLYRPAVWVGLAWLFIQLLLGAVALWKRRWRALAGLPFQLVLITAATVGVLALAEGGEEARLMITVLPLLAALPRVPLPLPAESTT